MNDHEPTGDIPLEYPPVLRGDEISLTPRQYQMVELLSGGLTNKEIALAMGISDGTVKVYLSRIPRHTGKRTRVGLALAFLAGDFCDVRVLRRKLHQELEQRLHQELEQRLAKANAREQAGRRAILKDRATVVSREMSRRKPTAKDLDDERWNRIFDEKLADPQYYRTHVTRSSPLARA
jgi:DNA-binding CsgD family transcriptional regulator